MTITKMWRKSGNPEGKAEGSIDGSLVRGTALGPLVAGESKAVGVTAELDVGDGTVEAQAARTKVSTIDPSDVPFRISIEPRIIDRGGPDPR